MTYLIVYQTTNKADFQQAIAILEEEGVRYEALYEYRLYQEKRHVLAGRGGAIIRVPRSVFHDADRLLVTSGLKVQEDDSANQFFLIRKLQPLLSKVPPEKRGLIYILLVAIGILLFTFLFLGLIIISASLF